MDLHRFEIRIQRTENLPLLPQIVTEVLVKANEDASARELEEIIEKDVAIAAKVLKVANSAFYAGEGQCSTLANAVGLLGFNTIKSLMVSIAYYQTVGTTSRSDFFSKEELWRHSLATATGAGLIGKMVLPLETDELYIAGLLHDIGFLTMDIFATRSLDRILKAAQIEQRPVHEIELEMLHWGHVDAGELLARKWGLPTNIMEAIRYHHEPMKSPEYLTSTCIISIANALAHECGFTNNSIGVSYNFAPEVLEVVDLKIEQLEPIKDIVVAEVIRAQEAFRLT